MAEPIGRRRFLERLSLGLSGLAAAVVSVPLLSYLLSPLLRPAPRLWLDVGPVDAFPTGQTVLRTIPEVSPLPWAGQTAETAIWVRRIGAQEFVVFAVNCTHLGCPVNWRPEAGLFLCPCHGGVYYADGRVAGGPPPRPLFRYATRVEEGRLQVRSQPLPIG
jgi:menaquinol-cytochrome c reductase iron-sulfur subunit